MLVLLAVLMFAVAVVFSILGQGGGVLYTPIQVWIGIDFHVAAATSLFLIMVMSLSASMTFRRARKIDWPLVLVLEASTVLGGFTGGFWSSHFSGKVLSILFAALVFTAAYFMIHSFRLNRTYEKIHQGPFWWHRQLGDEAYSINLAIALPVSFVVGMASGLVGVGGGIFKVPMMVLLFGVPMDIAIGCSALMVGVTAAGGFAGHVIKGHWDWRTSLVLGIAVFIGGQIGSHISLSLDKKKLKKAFGWFLLFIGLTMLVRLWFAY